MAMPQLRKLYWGAEANFPGELVFLLYDGFCSAYGATAEVAANVLGLTVTTEIFRGDSLPMIGFRDHSYETYAEALRLAGHVPTLVIPSALREQKGV